MFKWRTLFNNMKGRNGRDGQYHELLEPDYPVNVRLCCLRSDFVVFYILLVVRRGQGPVLGI